MKQGNKLYYYNHLFRSYLLLLLFIQTGAILNVKILQRVKVCEKRGFFYVSWANLSLNTSLVNSFRTRIYDKRLCTIAKDISIMSGNIKLFLVVSNHSGCKRSRLAISECCHNSSIHGKRNWFSEYLENNNIKKDAQCVHTIALVCSPKVGNNFFFTLLPAHHFNECFSCGDRKTNNTLKKRERKNYDESM